MWGRDKPASVPQAYGANASRGKAPASTPRKPAKKAPFYDLSAPRGRRRFTATIILLGLAVSHLAHSDAVHDAVSEVRETVGNPGEWTPVK